MIKQQISKIIFAVSRLCFVFTVALRIHDILGRILFNLNQSETYVILFLCLFGFYSACPLPHHRPDGIQMKFSVCKKKCFLSCKQLPNQV